MPLYPFLKMLILIAFQLLLSGSQDRCVLFCLFAGTGVAAVQSNIRPIELYVPDPTAVNLYHDC